MSTVFNFTFVPWFRSVAPYIHKFRNQTFVVAVCGEAIAAGKLPHLAQDLAMIQSMGVKIVLDSEHLTEEDKFEAEKQGSSVVLKKVEKKDTEEKE